MHDKIIKSTCSKVFNVTEDSIEIIERLKLGMSNFVYLIKCANNYYTFRIPGENAEVFVDRNTEKDGLLLIESHHLCGKTIYFDDEKGYKISEFIEGKVLYHNIKESDYFKVSEVLHYLHNIKANYTNSYNPFETLDYYETLNAEKANEKYINIKAKLLKYKEFLNKQNKVLCHNDSQPSNFVLGKDNNMYLLDYEFVGLNDPLYDIACFGNNDIENGLRLLKEYLGHTPNQEESNRFYLWRTFQNLQWFQVALYKHELKMDKGLDMDFEKIAYGFLDNAEISIAYVK